MKHYCTEKLVFCKGVDVDTLSLEHPDLKVGVDTLRTIHTDLLRSCFKVFDDAI